MKRYIRLKERRQRTHIHSATDQYLSLRPTLQKKFYYEETNSEFILQNEFSVVSDSKVFLVGDSFLENLFCESHNRISSVLMSLFASNGYDLNILNSGVSGMTSLNALNLIINKLLTLNPEHIILFIPSNDGHCMSLNGGLWNTSKAYSHLMGIPNISEVSRDQISNKIKNICNTYSLISQACTLFGVKLTVCSCPIIDSTISDFYLINKATHESTSYFRNLVFDSVLEHCKINGINTIDLRVNFSNKYHLFFDDVHTNDQGSREIGEFLFSCLKDEFNHLKVKSLKYNNVNLFHDISLNKTPQFSEVINVNDLAKQRVTLSFHIHCNGDVDINSALFLIKFEDFDNLATNDTGLKISSTLGNYKYITTKSHAKYRISYSFNIPSGITAFQVGFKSWRTGTDISISHVVAHIQDLENHA